jgi:hypothetical protein
MLGLGLFGPSVCFGQSSARLASLTQQNLIHAVYAR